MSRFADRTYPKEKRDYAKRLNALLTEFKTILIVEADNVLSGQMHTVRRELRGKADIVMGKNTLMRKVIKMRLDEDPSEMNEALFDAFCNKSVPILVGNVGLVLTNEPPADIIAILSKYKVKSPARVGAIAPIEVIIPAGKTGLEPTQTQFFLALDIPTKIETAQVTITKDVVVCRPGDKVGPSEAKLLEKMKIKPFEYGLETIFVYDDGVIFPRACVGVSTATLDGLAQQAVDDVAALSLATGVLTTPALSHLVVGAFKDVLALAIATDTPFEEFGAAAFIKNIKEGNFAAAAPAAASAAAPAAAKGKPAAAAPAEEEEEAADFGMDLF